MYIYVVEQVEDWGESRTIHGAFKNKQDAIDFCLESNLIPANAIHELKLIE